MQEREQQVGLAPHPPDALLGGGGHSSSEKQARLASSTLFRLAHRQAVSWQERRAARLVELGFQNLAAYLQTRHVEQGWPIKRMRAELGVGRAWLVAEMRRLGITP